MFQAKLPKGAYIIFAKYRGIPKVSRVSFFLFNVIAKITFYATSFFSNNVSRIFKRRRGGGAS